MKLKEYQERTLKEVKNFLEQLAVWKKRAADNPELEIDFPVKAWEKADAGLPQVKAAQSWMREHGTGTVNGQ